MNMRNITGYRLFLDEGAAARSEDSIPQRAEAMQDFTRQQRQRPSEFAIHLFSKHNPVSGSNIIQETWLSSTDERKVVQKCGKNTAWNGGDGASPITQDMYRKINCGPQSIVKTVPSARNGPKGIL